MCIQVLDADLSKICKTHCSQLVLVCQAVGKGTLCAGQLDPFFLLAEAFICSMWHPCLTLHGTVMRRAPIYSKPLLD